MNHLPTKKQLQAEIETKLAHFFSVTPKQATYEQFYKALALVIKDLLTESRSNFVSTAKKTHAKQVHYLCMEFLMGRSLKNNLYNLNLTDTAEKALAAFDIQLEKLYDYEPDAGLGNGGLGRLAACYLDGLATEGYNAMGHCILYEYGIFKQKIVDGWQTELPDFWLPGGEAWLVRKEEQAIEIKFGGYIEEHWEGSYHCVEHKGYTSVFAIPNDMYVPGKDGKAVSVLRLWDSTAPGLDMSLFNQGDYLRAMEQKAMAEVISQVLYPADNHPEGQSLRLRQQYFLVSAAMQYIVHSFLHENKGIEAFSDDIAIHINDTHPTLAVPELMRLLLDECGYSWEEAWGVVTRTFAYTNHTVMKEALEVWSEELVQSMLPRIYQILKEIDARTRAHVWETTHNAETVESLAVISNGVIRMANLCVIASHSVNGVSALHSNILKETVFHDFYKLTPDKFTNVTNGIAHRRWLCQANPKLTSLITDLIGDKFIYNAAELSRLNEFASDERVLKEIANIKQSNKQDLVKLVTQTNQIKLNPDAIFEVQIKRLHEYKRQHMNALNILADYLMIKDNLSAPYTPKVYLFAAKAAPGYYMAKQIINLIWHIATLVNNDPDANGKLQVAFLENYNVTLAEHLIPATEVSQQISLAGTEASGTGNMKFMMNGALTLGTLDGANVEIHEAVGDDNMFLFGMHTEEVKRLRREGYHPENYYQNNPELHRVIDFINTNVGGKEFREIGFSLINSDPYMVLADFADYRRQEHALVDVYRDPKLWNQMALHNIANSGRFAADRSVNEYAQNIWYTKPVIQ